MRDDLVSDASGNDTEVEYDEEGEAYTPERIALYPSRSEGRSPIKDARLLPSKIRIIYAETISALNNSQPILTAIGIRAIVEMVCKDRHAVGANLEQRIDGLETLGVLTQDGADILHKVRTLGNKAAHEVKPHTPEQLGLAIQVCEHLLLGVYLLPRYAKKTFD